jgi:hypothetical protein
VEEVVVILNLLTTRLLEGEVNATTKVEVVVMVATVAAERVQAESFMIGRMGGGRKGKKSSK